MVNLLEVKMIIWKRKLPIKLASKFTVSKKHAFQAEIMPKIMNHAKIGKIMKNYEIMTAGTPVHKIC